MKKLLLIFCITLPLFLTAKQAPVRSEKKPTEKTTSPKQAPTAPESSRAKPAAEKDTSPKEIPDTDEELEIPKPSADPPMMVDTAYQKQFIRTMFAIVIIIVVALIVVWILRRYSPARAFQANNRKNIKILERRHLSPNTFIYHIQVGDKQFILAESKFNVRCVANLDWNDSDSAT